ncbi:hypothetical protein WJX81_007327 [Elliptochloris bilobata]|uniref:Uncharacterized protein n=1 Tax=Elliptochloris bilobata TaxID=381761 RepID=A0AAW1S1L4_9CHLO
MCSATAGSLRAEAAAGTGLGAALPQHARNAVGCWLYSSAAAVLIMVGIGGVTRLTRSGLSMTEWKFTGEHWPVSQEEWDAEFAKYKASPEYQRVNKGMSEADFRFIYGVEYFHRMFGRAIGVVFVAPALFFAAKGWLRGPLAARVGLLFAAGGAQGLVGWWMVRSGLQEPSKAWEVPRVSPYRLAAHLTSAFAIFGGLLWTALSVGYPSGTAAGASATAQQAAASLRRWALPVTALVALTACSGAFVAGLDAGHAYNTFPTMNGRWVPEEYWAAPGWRNAFESTAAVQLHHRALALSTLAAVAALWAGHARAPLPPRARACLHYLLAATCAQVALGIATLLACVPPTLGSLHQLNAMNLLAASIVLLHALRRAPAAAGARRALWTAANGPVRAATA